MSLRLTPQAEMISMFLKPPDNSREWNIETSGEGKGVGAMVV
jgi:hypothetical protein